MIIALSDLHGGGFGSPQKPEQIEYILSELKKRIDVRVGDKLTIVLAGDIAQGGTNIWGSKPYQDLDPEDQMYKVIIPPFRDWLNSLSYFYNIEVIATPGNHGSQERLSRQANTDLNIYRTLELLTPKIQWFLPKKECWLVIRNNIGVIHSFKKQAPEWNKAACRLVIRHTEIKYLITAHVHNAKVLPWEKKWLIVNGTATLEDPYGEEGWGSAGTPIMQIIKENEFGDTIIEGVDISGWRNV